MKIRFSLVFMCFTLSIAAAGAQNSPAVNAHIQDAAAVAALVGISLDDLFARFGVPVAVYPLRGVEEWQDDVVFEYHDADFYIFRSHVWQISLKSAAGIKIGDSKSTLNLVYGSELRDEGTHVIVPIPNYAWPVEYRYRIDTKGKISAIYVYRPDY